MNLSNDYIKKYNSNIEAIQNYYNISNIAATYIYFRRKRSFPWKKKSDPKYLYWNAKLQNALIYADSIFGFDWESLEFGNEEELLKNYGIIISEQSTDLFRKPRDDNIYEDKEGNEWRVITKNKKKTDEQVLKSIGLLPRFV